MSATDKLLSIFALFTTERSEWTVEEAASQLGLAVSTAYRYFKSLSDAGLIVGFAAGRYVLGPAITQLDRQTRLGDPLIRAASPAMRRLAAEIGVPGTFLLCRLYRRQVICVHQETAHTPVLATSYERGRLMPLHRGAASKIILAHLPARIVRTYQDEHLEDIRAVGLGHDWPTLKRQLRLMRNAEVCLTHSELDSGALGLAAAIFGPDGTVIGSLGLVIEERDCGKELQDRLTKQMPLTAAQVTGDLRRIATGPMAQGPS
ncbi:IclR family transcriptional regulator [Acidocella aminolytica]|uniref:Transcriptional regulator n=1 Tax=Acidocella aminolytica 101 = DSM 11237 TaxID=1120923 RepID=A0A0D6PH46_9PROT|nr:IclR family transcriptional regulator C-terminal domain-containing protein [Acidocella aminolytica]GAN80538.1 transcriptional regulator [Acidocella aminolytica 101 = DSM 11237]GBQ43013.1 transcriptional regulator [Acidocella aminolytica 101 = DSM 11237]SHE29340.1 transcriptional regulator, IclR family [Acidocella aminolytica 101 = DSM 11237]